MQPVHFSGTIFNIFRIGTLALAQPRIGSIWIAAMSYPHTVTNTDFRLGLSEPQAC
jgi:hypothetical protein